MMRQLAAVLALALAACGTATSVPVPNIEDAGFAPALGVDLSASTKLDNGEYIREITVGTGDDVTAGKVLNVIYTGWLVNGTRFDGNEATGVVFSFQYGTGQVIAGWDQGFNGMKVGGARQLIIPPGLGYGAQGAPPSIPSNSILVFNVSLR
jgi:FKBP-type peptidyl-prolyl cis-trans isomerase